MTAETILSVVEKCYAASVRPGRWSAALTAVADYIGGMDTTIELHHGTGAVPSFFAGGSRLPNHGIDAYLAHYSKVCPRIGYIASRQAGEVGFDRDFISESEMDRDEFYADFLAPENLRYFLSATLANRTGKVVSFAAVHRSPRDGHASKSDARRLERLIPHLRQALDTHLRLEALRQRDGVLVDLLGRLDTGVVLLDMAGRIIHANASAEAILRASDGLCGVCSQLAFADPAARQRFAKILAAFLDGTLEAAVRPGGELFVPRPSGRPAYVVSVRRLPVPDGDDGPGADAAAIVFLHDPARVEAPAAERIASAFGLTQREAELAAALYAGQSLSEHAAERGIRLTTARFHLYQAMDKMGVRRQTDLVRLVGNLPSPLA